MTRKVALVGKPLRRRHSQVMHNAAFAHFGIDARYELRELDPGELEGFVREARGSDWLGFQVTAPYKEAVVSHLDRVEEAASRIGAVNSVVREADGSLVGFNTDAPGFAAAVEEMGRPIAGARALVAGAGGAARAVCWALLTGGAGEVVVANRTISRAEALADSLGDLGRIRAIGAGGPDLDEALAGAHLAVNATTVGMTSDGVPFPVALLPPEAAVFDLVYVPPVTPLVAAARERGLTVRNGLEMLVHQAEIAFRRWTGRSSSDAAMRRALEEWDRSDPA
ncbi:MAG: shikimate dehydrogenase [Actinomycetota bacterium]